MRYRMVGQILTSDSSMINGILLTDTNTGTNIRTTVLEAQKLYDDGKVDMPPY